MVSTGAHWVLRWGPQEVRAGMSGPWALREDPCIGAQEQKQLAEGREGRPRASMGQKLGLSLTSPQRWASPGLRVYPPAPLSRPGPPSGTSDRPSHLFCW